MVSDNISKEILLVGPLPPPVTGQTISFKTVAEGLKSKAGIRVRVIDTGGKGKSRGLRNIVRRMMDTVVWYWKLTSKLVSGHQGTVYSTTSQSKAGLLRDVIVAVAVDCCGWRYVTHLHGGNFEHFYMSECGPIWKGVADYIYGVCDIAIILSKTLSGMFECIGKEVKEVVVHNCSPKELDEWTPTPIDDGQPFRVLFISSMYESKGYQQVADAVELAGKKSNKKIIGIFCGAFKGVGRKERKRRFKNQCAESSGMLQYKGLVTGNEKNNVLSNSHVVALPSRYRNEGQPISLIEAIAHSMPVLATRYRGIIDVIGDEEAGYYIENDNVEQLAKFIVTLSERPNLYERLSKNAYRRYRRLFSRSEHINRIYDILSR